MALLVGLGNPGPTYAKHRHNVGFMAVDEIVRRHGFSPWRARFEGYASDGQIGSTKVVALKPLTYMNDSGQAVQAAARFYKLAPEEVFVFYDELDLLPGKVRVKRGTTASARSTRISGRITAGFASASAIRGTRTW